MSDPQDEEFGGERLVRDLERFRDRTLEESLSSLVEKVQEWSGSRGLEDDVSILAVEIGRQRAPADETKHDA